MALVQIGIRHYVGVWFITAPKTGFDKVRMSDVQWNLIGYARVSTDDQNLDLQRDALLKAGVPRSNIYEEYVSGVAKRRPELTECIKVLGPGDVLVIWKLDRLGRDLIEVVKLADELRRRDVQLRSLTEQIDTTSAYGKFFFHVIAAFAQLERDLISERTKAGIASAIERGYVPGRRPAISPEQWEVGARLLQADASLSITALQDNAEFRAAGWDGAKGKAPGRSTISVYRQDMRAGHPYPAAWQKYLDRHGHD